GLTAIADTQGEKFALPLKVWPVKTPRSGTHFREATEPGQQIGGATQDFLEIFRGIGRDIGTEAAGGHIEEGALTRHAHVHLYRLHIEQRKRRSRRQWH